MLSRRSFLTLVTGLASWSMTFGRATPQREDMTPVGWAALAALVGDTDAARAIGLDALKSYPQRLNSRSIERVLARLHLSGDEKPMIGRAALRECYETELRRDFAQSRIVDVQGWQLAETEVCLFAYLALKSGPGRSVT